MTYSEAISIIKNLNMPNPDADEMKKVEAIYEILTMGTLNSVTKDDLRRCIEWLWNQNYTWEK